MSDNSDDKKLVKQMLAGKQSAFDLFFGRYYPRIYRFCANRAPLNDAEDIAMKTMRQAMRRIETFRGESSLLSWLYTVARSQISAYFKHANRHKNVELIEDQPLVVEQIEKMAADPMFSPEGEHDRTQHIALVQSMLDSLPGEYGSVLEMKYVEGLAVEDIAGRLSTTSIATQSMLARARKAFKKAYSSVIEVEKGLPGTREGISYD